MDVKQTKWHGKDNNSNRSKCRLSKTIFKAEMFLYLSSIIAYYSEHNYVLIGIMIFNKWLLNCLCIFFHDLVPLYLWLSIFLLNTPTKNLIIKKTYSCHSNKWDICTFSSMLGLRVITKILIILVVHRM